MLCFWRETLLFAQPRFCSYLLFIVLVCGGFHYYFEKVHGEIGDVSAVILR
jgi:hypothetical protein